MPDFSAYFRSAEHISFDLWLTLVRSHPEFKQQRAALLKTHFHIPHPLDDVQKAVRYYDVVCNRINEVAGGNLDTYEIILLILSRLGLDLKNVKREQLDEFYSKMEALILQIPPILIHPDVPRMLSFLKASDFSLSLLSNTGFIKGRTLDKVLDKLGILEFFAFRIYSDEIGASKPNKSAFEAVFGAVCKFKMCNRENILHIGDNEIADVEGAAAYGFRAVLVSPDLYSIKEIIKK